MPVKAALTNILGPRPPGPAFVWFDRNMHPHDPQTMSTHHLFSTILMLWNHGMPADAATHDYARYRFSPETHGPDYLRRAVLVMIPLLAARQDLTPVMRARLDFMRAYLAPRRGLLPALEAPR